MLKFNLLTTFERSFSLLRTPLGYKHLIFFSINFNKFIEKNKINKSQEIFLGSILTLFFQLLF